MQIESISQTKAPFLLAQSATVQVKPNAVNSKMPLATLGFNFQDMSFLPASPRKSSESSEKGRKESYCLLSILPLRFEIVFFHSSPLALIRRSEGSVQTGNSGQSQHKNVFNKQLWIIRGHHVSVSVFSSSWLLLPCLVCLTIYTLLVMKKSPAQSPVAMGLEGGPFSQEVESWRREVRINKIILHVTISYNLASYKQLSTNALQ